MTKEIERVVFQSFLNVGVRSRKSLNSFSDKLPLLRSALLRI